MARISLKAYNREVESLIDSGQIDQAIAHCRHILKFYPKHVDTYRLLGKAYLESRRYGDAADILQRVLSSVPEDFVSHVGMSIIREDEGNLDEAIWHMERAFEVQPANNAIQEELRRLYGRRDGLEPPKVRLTRGALARMYAKGDLHQQAISELRAALAEDPERLDLQSLLAYVYARAGQRAEAAETCNTLMRKLPYCLEANRVMAEVLANSERTSETHPYLSRVQALDPYAAHLSPTTNTIQKIPEQMISLEKLDWKPGQHPEDKPSQPDWAASLGVAVEGFKSDDETLPEWLTSADKIFSTADKEDDAAREHSILEVSPESEFPWEDTSETELTDWLPESGDESAIPASDDEIPEWMKDAGWTQTEKIDEAEQEISAPIQSKGELDFGQTESEELAEAEIPEWLRAMAPPNAHEEPEQDISEEEFSWLPEETEDQVPSWMEEAESETKSELTGLEDLWQETEKDQSEEEIPDWVLGEQEPPEEEIPSEWLSEAAEDQGPDVISMENADFEDTTQAEEMPTVSQEEEMPAWLKEALADDEITVAQEESASEPGGEQLEAEELPEWLRSLDLEESTSEEDTFEEEPSIEWLLEDEQPEEVSDQMTDQSYEEIREEEIAAPAEDIPDWLKEMQPEEEEAFTDLEDRESIPQANITPEEPQLADKAGPKDEEQAFDFEDEEAAFAWLESLAVQQGAEEALLMSTEERQEKTSEWLQEEHPLDESTSSEKEQEAVEEIFAQPEPLPLSEEEGAGTNEAQIIEWEPQFPEQEDEISEEEQAPASAEAIPDWLPEADAFDANTEQAEKVQETETGSPMPEEATFDLEDEDAAFAWLESLAVKQGADEALLMSPEERQAAEFDFQSETQEVEVEQAEEQPEISTEPTGEEILEQPISEMDLEAEIPFEQMQAKVEAESYREEGEPEQTEVSAPSEAVPVEQKVDEEKAQGFYEEDTKPVRVTPPDESSSTAETVPVVVSPEQPESAQEIKEPDVSPETEPEEETPPEEEPRTPPFVLDESPKDEDTDFAWLESLAVKQGADEALLLSSEERQETRPEWLPEAAEDTTTSEEDFEGETISEQEAPLEEGVEEEFETAEELPGDEEPTEEELEQPIPEADEIEKPGVEKYTPEMPAWLQELVAEEEFSEIEPATEETTVPPFTEETIESEEVPELPGWLAEVEKGKEASEQETWTPPEAPIRRLNLNEASLSELEKLPDIGFILAQSIVAYRETFGPYKEIDDLSQVSGIGSSTIDDLRQYVYVEPSEEPATLLEENQEVPETIKQARNLLNSGKLDDAIETYMTLINSHQFLSQVIQDLDTATGRYPQEFSIWQALGDAYLRSDQIREALDAYTKAEEFLR